jgi:hypothetical protein
MVHRRRLAETRFAYRSLCSPAFALALLAGGCSKAPPPPAPASQAKVDPCGGLTAADAASILKIASADVKGPLHFKAFSCVYRAKDDFYKNVSFNVYPEASAARAARKLQSEKEGFAFLSPIKALDKLGDEAYRAPDSRVKRLLVRKGRVWVDVTTPGDEASQRRIAQIVLKHLP